MCTESISTHNFTFPFGEITSQIHKLWCKSESPCSTTICSRHPPNCVIRAMKRSYSTEQCANVFYVARFARNIPQRSLWLIYAIALGYLCFKSCLRVFFCLQSFHIHKLCLFCSWNMHFTPSVKMHTRCLNILPPFATFFFVFIARTSLFWFQVSHFLQFMIRFHLRKAWKIVYIFSENIFRHAAGESCAWLNYLAGRWSVCINSVGNFQFPRGI